MCDASLKSKSALATGHETWGDWNFHLSFNGSPMKSNGKRCRICLFCYRIVTAEEGSGDGVHAGLAQVNWSAGLAQVNWSVASEFLSGCNIMQLNCRLWAVHTRCNKIDCQCPLRFFILGVILTDWTFCLAASQVTAAYLLRHRASRHNAQHSASLLVRPVSVRGWKLLYLGLLRLSSFHCGSELWAWLSWELAAK
jgi:hypothetical protein